MSALEIKSVKSIDLHSIKIHKNDLLKLIELIKGAFPSESDICSEIQINYKNKRIKTKTIDELLSINGLPDKLDNLEISFWGNENSIFIILAKYRKNLSVSGKDDAWVIGNFHKILSFFSDTKPWFYSQKYVFLFLMVIVGLLGGVTSYLFINKYLITSILFACVLLLTYYFMFSKYFDEYFPACEIILSPRTSIIDKDMIVIILTGLTLIVTIIGGIILPILYKN